MAMDPTATVAVFAFAGTVVTVIGGAVVAIYTNRSEKKQSAETALEKTLRERITFRDEQIAGLQGENARLIVERDRYKAAADELRLKGQGATNGDRS